MEGYDQETNFDNVWTVTMTLTIHDPSQRNEQIVLNNIQIQHNSKTLWARQVFWLSVNCDFGLFGLYTFVKSQAFMAGDADSSRASGLTYGLQGSVNVQRGALFLVPQWQCIIFVFYIGKWP